MFQTSYSASWCTLYDELLYGDRPAWSSSQSVEEDTQQFGDGVGVGTRERPLFTADCDEREAGTAVLHVPANNSVNDLQTEADKWVSRSAGQMSH